MMVAIGDYVSGVDSYGNSVAGEVFSVGGGYAHVQPDRIKDAAGQYVDVPPVMIQEAACQVIERLENRESHAQRDARLASQWQAVAVRLREKRKRKHVL